MEDPQLNFARFWKWGLVRNTLLAQVGGIACLLGLFLLGVACDLLGTSDGPPPPEPPPGKWEYLGLGGENISDIESIAVHPEDPDVIYVGSGFDFSNGIQGKLFKTTDGGATWDTLLVGGSYLDIEVDPQDPKTVYALPGGIVKSKDGGENWTVIDGGLRIPTTDKFAKSLAIDPQNPEVLYAGLGGFFGGCPFKSTDGGESWTELASTQDDIPPICAGVTSLRVHPKNSEVVYAGTADLGEVFKSTDAGETWRRTLEATRGGGVVFFIRVASDGETVFAGRNASLHRSTDGGESWSKLTMPDSVGSVEALRIDLKGRRYLATRAGVYLSRAGSGWAEMNTGLPKQHRWVKALAVDPRGERLYAGVEPSYAGDEEHGLYVRDLTTTEETSQ